MKKQQEFLVEKCRLCSNDEYRTFVTHADNPNKIICTNCGFTKLKSEKREEKQNGI